jgi:hypothetical protein
MGFFFSWLKALVAKIFRASLRPITLGTFSQVFELAIGENGFHFYFTTTTAEEFVSYQADASIFTYFRHGFSFCPCFLDIKVNTLPRRNRALKSRQR